MSDKDPPNPFEEIQRQLSELFKDSNVKESMNSFAESNFFADESSNSPDETIQNEAVSETDPLELIRHFKLKPKEVRDHLNRFVIRQDEAKKVLSVAICDHYNHVRQSLSAKKTLAK